MMRLLIPAAALAMCAAVPGQYFEARNSAMGGVGVASSRYLSAGFANPALLTRFDEDDTFGIILPALGATVSDKDDLIDAIDQFQANVTAAEQAIANATVTPTQLTALANELNALNGKTITGSLGAGFTVAIPSDTLAFAIVLRSYLDVSGVVVVDPNDPTTILAAGNIGALQSEAVITSAGVTDLGLAMAHEFDFGAAKVSVGATPKLQRVDTYNYSININNFDEDNFDDSQFRDDDSNFNLDLGVSAEIGEFFTAGAMLRNALSEDYNTPTIATNTFTYQVQPMLTLGAAFHSKAVTLAVDVDVTQNERFKGLSALSATIADSSDDSQYVRAGIEFDLFKWAQLRGGFQHDIEDTTEDLLTAGLGFSPFDVFHLDIAGMIGDGDTYGAVAQMSLTF